MNSVEIDAARYRWLRDTQNKESRDPDEVGAGCIESLMIWTEYDEDGFGSAEGISSEDFDTSIDKAMKRWPA